MTDVAETLGRFGHHPDPAIDFEVEVENLEAIWIDRRNRFANPSDPELERRVERALQFRVGGHLTSINAKDTLRAIASGIEAQDDAIVAIVAEAMADAWNEICADTECHPLDIEQMGRRRLDFSPRHWARLTGLRVAAALGRGLAKAQPSEDA